MSDFFTIEKIFAYIFFLACVFYFLRATESKKKDIWAAILGADKTLQVPEIATIFWCWMFPILFFINISIVLLGLELDDKHVALMTKVWYSMDAMFGFVMFGHGLSKFNKDKK